jgi:hypothetical protein
VNERPNRAERRGHDSEPENLEPSTFVYSRDPWDERRFNKLAPRRFTPTTSWEAAAPFLLILGLLVFFVLVVLLVHAFAG